MSKLDSVILRGTVAAQPVATAVATGALYFQTDTGLIQRSNGTTWDSYSALAAGALALIEQHTASVSATLDFTTGITTTYDDYLVELLSLIPATNGAALNLQVSIDGGATWLTTGYRYALIFNSDAGASPATYSSAGAVVFNLGGPIDSSREGISGSMRLYNPRATIGKHFRHEAGWAHTDTNRYGWSGSIWQTTTSAVNALRFKMDSGNITSGVIRLYGIAKS